MTDCSKLVWSIRGCKGRISPCTETDRDAFILKIFKPTVEACTTDTADGDTQELQGLFIPADFAKIWDSFPTYKAVGVLTFVLKGHPGCNCKERHSLFLTVTGAEAIGLQCSELTVAGRFPLPPRNPCAFMVDELLHIEDVTFSVCGDDVPVTASCTCSL